MMKILPPLQKRLNRLKTTQLHSELRMQLRKFQIIFILLEGVQTK